MSTLSSSSRRSGFSLIEVAIALAIFVFGALAIVQIFPPALGVIRNNENRATATQMSEGTLARMSAKHSQPPEAVFDVDATGNWQDFPGSIVGSVSKNNSLPNSPEETAYTNSALGRFRYIYGEPHYIGAGKTIMLNYPYDDSFSNLSFFTDQTIEDVQIGADGYLDFTNATDTRTGASFNDTANPVLPPSDYRGDDFTYYISYRWHTGTAGSRIQGVIEEPLKIPALAMSSRVFACSFVTTNKTIPGGIKVLLRSRVTLSSTSALDLGSGRKIISIQNVGTAPATLYCNYLAADWRNIISDGAPQNNIISLPVTGVNTSSILGILTNSNQTSNPELKAPDLSTTEKRKIAEKGKVEFAGTSVSGARVRAIYRTLEGWAHQPSVAPRSYIPFDVLRTGAIFPREPWREYFWDGAGNLYFHPSEAGKTISASFGYMNGGSYQIINKSVITIRQTIENAPGFIPAGFFGAANTANPKVARAEITNLLGDTVSPAAILGIQGLSIQARTAWQNGDRYNQVIVPGYRTLIQ